MSLQSDLFGDPIAVVEGVESDTPQAMAAPRSLAMPCGFLDSSNKACRRLGARSVMIEGAPFVCRRIAMVHCDPECFRSTAIPVDDYGDDDDQRDASQVAYAYRISRRTG